MDDGTNYLAVAPGVVMGYERNVARTPCCASTASKSSPSPAKNWAGARWSALYDVSDRARSGMTRRHNSSGIRIELTGRSFLRNRLHQGRIPLLIDLAQELRTRNAPREHHPQRLQYRTDLEKTSTRTRAAFEWPT